jgi:hypothetical protein
MLMPKVGRDVGNSVAVIGIPHCLSLFIRLCSFGDAALLRAAMPELEPRGGDAQLQYISLYAGFHNTMQVVSQRLVADKGAAGQIVLRD